MKKCLFFMVLGSFVHLTSSDCLAIDRGTVAINPSSGIMISITDRDSDVDWQSINIDATVGYFVADNVELGLGIGTYQYSESGTSDYSHSDNFFRPYVELYFPVSTHYFFAGAAVYVDTDDYDNGSSYTDDTFAITLEGGLKVMLAQNISLDLGAMYVMGDFERSGDYVGDYSYTRINLLTGFKFYL